MSRFRRKVATWLMRPEIRSESRLVHVLHENANREHGGGSPEERYWMGRITGLRRASKGFDPDA